MPVVAQCSENKNDNNTEYSKYQIHVPAVSPLPALHHPLDFEFLHAVKEATLCKVN